jgi:hypothetical protein
LVKWCNRKKISSEISSNSSETTNVESFTITMF